MKGSQLTELHPVESLKRQPPAQQSPDGVIQWTHEIVDDLMSKVDPSVSESTKDKLKTLLHKHKTVFSAHEWDLGWTDRVVHTINTGNSRPTRQPLRRYPPAHLQVIDKYVDEMLRNDVIEPSLSPWAANVVLVKKKDGTFRCFIDYRQLNAVTRSDAYPLPRIDQCLNALNRSSLYSTVDMRCGYMQTAMSASDADKTTFITRRGLYRFKVMPFGLTNAPATFQRLVDLVLQGLNEDICLAYLDDVILHSRTEEEHLERLDRLFTRLEEANLKLKRSKCQLLQKKVLFLGYVVSGEGITNDPEKTRLIEDWPIPQNLRQLRGFLGLSGYYRRFVKGYSAIAAPLHDLTKKSRSFLWTSECQQAFEELKRALSTSPVLALPNDRHLHIGYGRVRSSSRRGTEPGATRRRKSHLLRWKKTESQRSPLLCHQKRAVGHCPLCQVGSSILAWQALHHTYGSRGPVMAAEDA